MALEAADASGGYECDDRKRGFRTIWASDVSQFCALAYPIRCEIEWVDSSGLKSLLGAPPSVPA